MLRSLLTLLSLGLLAAAPARAQTAIPEAESLVRVTAPALEVAAGGRAEARVTLRIEPDWHINANPPSLDYMIPTTLTLAGAGGVTAAAPIYPAAHRQKLAFEESELLVYDGEAVVRVPLSVAAGTAPGVQTLRGTIGFQACNDEVCLAPVNVPFTLQVTVAAGAGPGAAPPMVADTSSPTPGTDPAAGTPAGDAGFTPFPGPGEGAPPADATTGSLLWFFWLFAGGLALNLTPCVFPMLGVTVSIFGARRQEPLPKVVAHATAYVLGIAVMYTSLGVVAALTGGLFGAALQNTWVNVGIGVLIIVLALSMFGLYELQPPLWIVSRFGGADTTSLAGIFMSGLGVGIIAAPCVGPLVVTTLALIAKRQDVWFGVQTMGVVSLGLGLPYIVLATSSNLLQRLPRSGDWMVWVKKLFGVIMFSVGAFYVMLALAPRHALWVTPVALIIGGVWLGFLVQGAKDKPMFRTVKRIGGALAVIAGIVFIATTPSQGILFRPYDAVAVAGDLPRSRPVMVEFSADWCLPCHELERVTFTDRRVIEAMRSFDVFKVDLTRYNSPEADEVRRLYGVRGVPTIIFLDATAREIPGTRVERFLDPEPFLQRVRLAAAGGPRAAAE